MHRKSRWKISLPCCAVNNPLTGARYGQFCFGSVPHWPSGASSPARAGWPSTGRTLSNGNLQADGWLPSWVFFPLFVGIEFLSLELWNNFEQTGYYRHWGEIGASVTRSMNFCSPAVRLWKFVLDLLFFFGFGFAIPCAEMMAILIN